MKPLTIVHDGKNYYYVDQVVVEKDKPNKVILTMCIEKDYCFNGTYKVEDTIVSGEKKVLLYCEPSKLETEVDENDFDIHNEVKYEQVKEGFNSGEFFLLPLHILTPVDYEFLQIKYYKAKTNLHMPAPDYLGSYFVIIENPEKSRIVFRIAKKVSKGNNEVIPYEEVLKYGEPIAYQNYLDIVNLLKEMEVIK